MKSGFSPVVMFAYNRPDCLNLVFQNLTMCDGINDRDVHVFVDAPKTAADGEKHAMCLAIIDKFAKQLKRLQVHLREKNFGCGPNIRLAITEIVGVYGRVIVVEDDILVSRVFLKYMDSALDYFENDHQIWCINGFRRHFLKLPLFYKYDYFLSLRNGPWGWATWKDRWMAVDFDLRNFPGELVDPDIKLKVEACGLDLVRMLHDQKQGHINTWDVQCGYYMAKNGLFAVEPRYSVTKNIGFRADATHTIGVNYAILNRKYFEYVPRWGGVCSNESISSQYRDLMSENRYSLRWCFRAVERRIQKYRYLLFGDINMAPIKISRHD